MIQLKKPTVLLLLVTQSFQANRQIVTTKFPMINKVKKELLTPWFFSLDALGLKKCFHIKSWRRYVVINTERCHADS